MAGTNVGMYAWSNVCCDGSRSTRPLDGYANGQKIDDSAAARHNSGENLAFCDGHVKWSNTRSNLANIWGMMDPTK
ncbi:MAG: H-X9-DG-CTERM domain-containing protein [Armatimonadota bacterium]|nr:H-X9-DG-CTERM domain-containing protein [Armatimonadota bacterium]